VNSISPDLKVGAILKKNIMNLNFVIYFKEYTINAYKYSKFEITIAAGATYNG